MIIPLERDLKRGMVGGVCAGIANLFEWDVYLVRWVTLALALATSGVTILAYLAIWGMTRKLDEAL